MGGKGRDTRARIEAAAIRLFADRGVASTSVRDIAADPQAGRAVVLRRLLAPGLFRLDGPAGPGLSALPPVAARGVPGGVGRPPRLPPPAGRAGTRPTVSAHGDAHDRPVCLPA